MDILTTTICYKFDIAWPVSRTRMLHFNAHILSGGNSHTKIATFYTWW